MIHPFRIGPIPATIISDGPLALPAPAEIFPGAEAAALVAYLSAARLPLDAVRVEQNCLLVEAGSKLALFDNGMGSSPLFGRNSGKLLAGLREAGVDPGAIDLLVLTHAHSDHCWGTMGDDGAPNFRNAEIRISQAEYDFWEAEPASQGRQGIAGFRRHVAALRERVRFVRDGETILPGIHAWSTPGHTPGHMAYLFDAGGETWCLMGDVAFHDPISYAMPDAETAYDAEGALAVATRRRVLQRLAAERLRVIGYHQSWPGLGRIERAAGGYRFIPDGDHP